MRELGGRCQECLVWTSEACLGAKQVSQVVGAGAHRWKKQGERAPNMSERASTELWLPAWEMLPAQEHPTPKCGPTHQNKLVLL